MKIWDGKGTIVSDGFIVQSSGGNNYTIEQLVNDGASITYIANHDGKQVFLKHFKDPNELQEGYQEFIEHQKKVDIKLKDLSSKYPNLNLEENYELFESNGRHFQAKKIIKNATTLEKVLEKNPSLSQRLLISRDLLKTLKALHDNDTIYSDLKPEQILLSEDDTSESKYKLTLIDFDHAILIEAGKKIGNGAGTDLWWSPEYLDNKEKYFESDVFTISLLVNYLLSGYHPFQEAVNDGNYNDAIKNYNCKRLSERNPAYSKTNFKNIDELLYKSWDPSYKNRPTVGKILEAFEELFTSSSNPKALQLKCGSNTMTIVKEQEITREICKSIFPDIYNDIFKTQFKFLKDKSGKWLVMGTNATKQAKDKKGNLLTFYSTFLNDNDITNKPTILTDGDTISVGTKAKFQIKFIR